MDRVIKAAENEIGYLEKRSNNNLFDKTANAGENNYTKYWAVLKPSFQGQAWCNAFINYVFTVAYDAKAKSVLCTKGDWSYYTPTSAQYFKDAHRWFSVPQKGDIIYFKNEQRIHHVGLVTRVYDNKVETIEGNTSSGAEVIPNGGAVCRKAYSLDNKKIAGYGRPMYELVTYTPGWNKDSKGWWYAKDTMVYAKNEWLVINGCWYWFDAEGYAVQGKKEIGGKLYFFCDENGHPKECALMKTDKKGALYVWEGVE